MTLRSVRPLLVCATLIASASRSPTSASAQTSLEIPLDFNFVNPGAKSLALGGAFAGVADDATAAFANPAGLTLLITPEVSAELRRTGITTTSLERGRLSGTVTNIGADDEEGGIFNENFTARNGLRYLAVVYPHSSHRWVVAEYRHELARVHQRLDSDGVFQQDPTETEPHREFPYEVERDVSITGYGASGAYKPFKDMSIGAGLAVYDFSLDSVFRQFSRDGLYDAPDYTVDFDALSQQGGALGVAPTFGLTYDRGRARAGVVYRHGASFDFTTQDGDEDPRSATFRVPHTLALGVSFRAMSQLLLSGEVTRIEYSRLVSDFVTEQAQASGEQASFTIDDGTEFHLSAQYALRREGGAPVRLRVGTWYDPDHSVHFRAARTPTTAQDRLFDERFTVALSQGASHGHITGGVGITFTSRLEFNAGLDVASRSRQFSASAIVHLGSQVLP